MGRRRKGGGNLTAMMDIMTAAIGCLVLVLISCLMLVLITNVSIYFGDPNNMSVGSKADDFALTRYVQDEFGEVAPFPMGNREKSPVYIDVQPDRLVFYPSRDVMSIHDLRESGNPFELELQKYQDDPTIHEREYIILLIRPYTATIANELRRRIKSLDIQMGYELFPDEKEVKFRDSADFDEEGNRIRKMEFDEESGAFKEVEIPLEGAGKPSSTGE